MDSLYKLFFKENFSNNPKIKFNVILIVVISMMFLTFYFEYEYSSVIILLVFSLWLANYYVMYENENFDDFNNLTMSKLGAIQKKMDEYIDYKINLLKKTGVKGLDINKMYNKSRLSSLYMDANMITFLHSVIHLSKWNNELYFKLVIGTNNILKLLEEIEIYNSETQDYPENISQMLEIAMELRLKTINNLHDFIYTIPKGNESNRYLHNITERYRLLITRDTDKIHNFYLDALNKRGINNMTKFINYFDSPRALDPNEFNKFY